MKKMLVSSLLVAGLAVGSSAMVFASNNGDTSNTGSGYSMMGNGNGSGMMGGSSHPGSNRSSSGSGINQDVTSGNNGSGNFNPDYGYGPGMMGYGGYGYGMGPGMMGYGGYGYGMGPGMMGYGGYGYGMGPDMMGYGGYGYGMGPGMMGYGGYGMMGGCGYGMGPGMMGYFHGPNSGRAYGSMWNGWQKPEQIKKFLDATVELRRKLNDKLFDLHEALRKPSTNADTLAKLQTEIIDLRNKISEKAGDLR